MQEYGRSEILLNDSCEGNYMKLILLMNLHGCSIYSGAKGSWRYFVCMKRYLSEVNLYLLNSRTALHPELSLMELSCTCTIVIEVRSGSCLTSLTIRYLKLLFILESPM